MTTPQTTAEVLPGHYDNWPSDDWLRQEMLTTLSDMARGIGPRTVMHALLARRKEMLRVVDVMVDTGQTEHNITLAMIALEERGWALRATEKDITGRDVAKYIIRGAMRD